MLGCYRLPAVEQISAANVGGCRNLPLNVRCAGRLLRSEKPAIVYRFVAELRDHHEAGVQRRLPPFAN